VTRSLFSSGSVSCERGHFSYFRRGLRHPQSRDKCEPNHAGDDERGRRNHVFENLKALPWPSTFNVSTSKTEIFPSQSHRYVVPKRDKRGDGDGVALSFSNTYNPRPMALPQFLRPAVELEREPPIGIATTVPCIPLMSEWMPSAPQTFARFHFSTPSMQSSTNIAVVTIHTVLCAARTLRLRPCSSLRP